jgi:hypothetical protein
MKTYSLLCGSFLIMMFCISCGNTTSQATPQSSSSDTASIFFREYEHNFGKIAEGEKVGCVFTFENRGTAPLVVNSAVTSCGCTVPKFDKKPVPPGGTGTLEVIFDSSGRGGVQTKTITVKSNATKPLVLLRITGEVVTNSNNN